MLVACLTSLVALNGKNHAGTGNSAAFTVTQPLERAQNDAFGPPNLVILYTVPVESSTGRSTGRGHGSVEKRVVAAQSSVGTRMP